MNINERLAALETKVRIMEKAIYFLIVISLADLGIAII